MVSEKGGPIPKHEHSPDFEKERAVTELVENLQVLRKAILKNPDDITLRLAAQSLIDEYLPEEDDESRPELVDDSEDISEAPGKTSELVTEPEPQKEKEQSLQEISFEAAEKQSHELSDEIVDAMLANDLRVGNEKVIMLKNFLDSVPADESGKEFTRSAEQKTAFHNDLADFMKNELRIVAPSSYDTYLRSQRNLFSDKLDRDKGVVKQHFEAQEGKGTFPSGDDLVSAVEFKGFRLPTSSGKAVDLLEFGTHIDDIYPNLAVQRSMGAPFLQWSSEKFIQGKIDGSRPDLTRRIYLNPRPQMSVEILKEIAHALNGAGLTAKIKILDRSSEGSNMRPEKQSGDVAMTRADGLVLTTTDADATAVLERVNDIYQQYETAFEGRAVPKIPVEVKPGMALGSEPTGTGESLTSHREKVLSSVWGDVMKSGETDPATKKTLFKNMWRSEAIRNNINPDNIAFSRS